METHAFGFTLPTQHPEGQKRFPISRLLGVALILAVVNGTAGNAVADPKGFVLTPLAFLGAKAPGGGTFAEVFESNVINNRGDVLFGSNRPQDTPGAEFLPAAVFLRRRGVTSEIARTGELAPPAPDGGTFARPGFLSPITLNERGDAAFAFLLEPFSFPVGLPAGVYRFSSSAHKVSPVVIPGVTAAPGGGVFAGASFGASLNDRGDLVFAGIVPMNQGVPFVPFSGHPGLGQGLFRARGAITNVVSPGDAAPPGGVSKGGVFDLAAVGFINNRGDVAFEGHVAGEECLPDPLPPNVTPPEIAPSCLWSLYVKDGATGKIRSVAHAGDQAPGGGVFRQAFSPVLNDSGAIAFLGDLTPAPAVDEVTGVYLHRRGVTIAVARPGDAMPGGGNFVTSASISGWQIDVNNAGEVVFNATLNTHAEGDEFPDTGLYLFSHGKLRLVARTGTKIPGVPGGGTIAQLVMNVPLVPPPPTIFFPNSGANNNNRGQVVFGATLTDGRGVLLLATPR
jgi:hypothetical protein